MAEKKSAFEKDPVTGKELMGYNMGAIPGAFFGGFMGQIQAFYYRWMGLDWTLIIIAQFLYALWNVINDPLFGLLMNKTKTKQGRYIPWIRWSGPLLSLGFFLVFIVPNEWRTGLFPEANPYMIPLFIWYLVSQLIYDTFFTIAYIAHVALLPQMTMASRERTKVSAIAGLLTIAGGVGAGALPLIFLTPPTEESIFYFRIFVVIFAIISVGLWAFVVKWVKERQEFIPDETVPLKKAFMFVFKNPSGRAYIIYDGISVGILNILLTGVTFMFSYILGIGLDEGVTLADPTWGLQNVLLPIGLLVAGAALGVVVQLWIPKKRDIKTAILVGLICQAVGFTIAFLGALPDWSANPDIWTPPPNLWLLGIGLFIGFFGLVTDLLYHNPMRADTIDYDEYLTGERHEAIYAGIGCIFSKPMISVALAIVPGMMGLFGLRPALATDPTSDLFPQEGYPMAMLGIALVTFLVPAIFAAIGAVAWYRYPLDRKALKELHAKLEVMHEEKREQRLGEDGLSRTLQRKDKPA